jgi:MFS family permease
MDTRPYRVLTAGMVAIVSIVAFESVAVTTAMPTVARALHGLSLYALAFGGALAAGIVGLVVAGEQADRSGPKRPMWTGVVCFAAGLLVAGLAPAMWVLVAGRVVQGYGGGLMTVALYVVVARAYPPALHPRVFAAFAAAWVVPSMVGPLFAGLIVEHLGWRWVFLSMLILGAPCVLLVRPALVTLEATPGPRRSGRAAWAFGAAVAAVLLHLGGQRTGWVAVALLSFGLLGLLWSARRLLPAGTFTARPGLPSVVVLRGLAGAAFIQADVFLPLLLSRERGFPPSAAGLTVTVAGVAWAAGSWYQGHAGQRHGAAGRVRAGMGLICAGVMIAALCVAPAVPAWVCIAGWAVGGLGMGLVYPAMSALTLRLSRPEEQGANSSALQLADSLFSTSMLAVGGSLFAARLATPVLAYGAAFALALLPALLGLLVALRFQDRSAAPTARTAPASV